MFAPEFTAYESLEGCSIVLPSFGVRVFVGADDDGHLHVGYQLDGSAPCYAIVGALEHVKLSIWHDLDHEDDK